MAQFLKINPLSDDVNGTSLVNFSEAAIMEFQNTQTCKIYYSQIGNSSQAAMSLDGISSGVPVLMDSIQQAVEASPSAHIIPLPSVIGAVEYLGN